MAVPQKRPVALLDVDGTLMFGNADDISYNNNLIDTLIENNIIDVYLFTSMTLKKKGILERAKLIEHLQSRGLKVHGLICASDLIWNKDKELIKDYFKEQFQYRTDEEACNLFDEKKYNALTHFNDAIPGQAYAAVSAEANNDRIIEEANRNLLVVSDIRQFLKKGDRSENAELIAKSEKAYLYQMFVNNKPGWAGDVIYAEDAEIHIAGVLAMHNQLAPEHKHKLLTVYNEGKKENPKSFYQALIEPFVKLLNLFNSYVSERYYSYSSEKNRILDDFRQALEGCNSSKEIDILSTQFRNDYQTLNTHRFSFWSNEKTRSATLFDEMVAARLNQFDLFSYRFKFFPNEQPPSATGSGVDTVTSQNSPISVEI